MRYATVEEAVSGLAENRRILRFALVGAVFTAALVGHSGGVFAEAGQKHDTYGQIAGSAGQSGDVDLKPARIVILVDLSGSIREQDMERERQAASVIAQSELSKESQVAVVGFASDNGAASPVDVACPPTVVAGAAERDRLTQCIAGLRKREKGKGDGTDHAAALQQALGYLRDGSPEDGPKLVFLLTDGDLDVRDSTRYGVDKSGPQRNDAAREVIRKELVTAKESGVQVWPLGFGNVQKPALDEFASGGYQGDCGPSVPKPSTTIVQDSADVATALFQSFATGRCNGRGPIENTDLGSGDNVEIPVTIPAIATNGSIIVVKHDPRISVEYLDPDGVAVPKQGTSASGSFEVSGESSPVEVLRIVDPKPGGWTVRVSSLPDIPPQKLLTTVTWQGAAQATLLVDPPSPGAGQPVTLTLRVVLRGGRPVTDPELLKGLDFSVEMQGAGEPVAVPVSDSGTDPDAAADGTYTGRLTLPSDGAGRATFRGRVAGLGISAADAIASVEVTAEAPRLLATATLPTIGDDVEPGDEVAVPVAVGNDTGARQELRVQVEAPRAVVTIPEEDTTHTVDPGSSGFTFRLLFGEKTEGVTTGTVRIVDSAGRVLHEKSFTVDVQPPFPWLEAIVIGIASMAVLALAVFLVLRRRAQEVEGLVVHAIRGGQRRYLHTEARKAKQFRFTVAPFDAPHLDIAQPGDLTAFVLTRSGAGLRLRTPYQEVLTMHLGQEVSAGDGLTILVTADEEPAPVEQGAPGFDDYGTATQTTRDPYE